MAVAFEDVDVDDIITVFNGVINVDVLVLGRCRRFFVTGQDAIIYRNGPTNMSVEPKDVVAIRTKAKPLVPVPVAPPVPEDVCICDIRLGGCRCGVFAREMAAKQGPTTSNPF